MTSGRGTILTTAKRSGLEIKFYYRMQCRLPGAFLPFEQSYITWWPHHSGSVAFLSGKSGPVVIALWSGKPVTVCVSWETYTGFLADFPCEQKQKSTQGTRKLNPWPTEGKTETEICVCEQVTLHKWKEMSGQGGQSQRFESWPQSSPDAWFQANSFSSSIRWEWNSSIYLTRLLCELVNIGQVPRTLPSTQ